MSFKFHHAKLISFELRHAKQVSFEFHHVKQISLELHMIFKQFYFTMLLIHHAIETIEFDPNICSNFHQT